MGVTKTTRLQKAAGEFNVGMGKIVDFLHRKGFDIDVNPNAKITPEMYVLLTKEFMGEKNVKEEARKKGLGNVKRETISIEDRRRETPDIDDYEEDDHVIIRGGAIEVDEKFKKSVEPRIESTEKIRKDHEKVIEKEPEKEVVPVELKTPEVVSDPVFEKPEEIIHPDPKLPEVPEIHEFVQTSQSDEPEGKSEIQIHAEPTSIQEISTLQEVETDEKHLEKQIKELIAEGKLLPEIETHPETLPETSSEEVVFENDVPKLKQPKVLGTIDLSSINERTKPPRKSAEEKRIEREGRRKGIHKLKPENKDIRSKPDGEKKTPRIEVKLPAKKDNKKDTETLKTTSQNESNIVDGQKQDNFLETKFEKLQGPNIIGRISLPVDKKLVKKKPVASSSDEKVKPKKKKRKRIKKLLQNQQSGTEQPTDETKAKAKPPRVKKIRREVKPELNEEDIQKQIKETLARLSGVGKSKTSKHRRQKRDFIHKKMEQELLEQEEGKHQIKVAEFVTANELSTMMNVPVTDVISMCMQLGLFVSINQRLDAETISLVAEEFGFKVEFASVESTIDHDSEEADDPEQLASRPPIVTVMGHVDHGKTKLLDYIRHTNVIAGEAGGITQHIGAYEVLLENGKKITFLDTPGHEAFTAMRARGAKVTDVAIIVVAADDSVMPQTKEAINHALAANVPIVFAINKIDKPTANTERIREQLSQMNILVEDWGGKYQSQEISAKAGLNIEVLLDKVLLEAEMLDLKSNPNRRANGTTIESSLDKGRGYVSKLLVQNGTLRIGDIVLAGSYFGKVKAMYNERNQAIKEAGPASPVLMLGLNGAPQAGDLFKVLTDEREAKNIATKRMQLQREQGLRTQKHITLDEIGRRIAIGDFKELNIIVKGDVDGSVEALSDSLLKLGNEEVQVNVIHKSVGQVTETDVMLASASNAIIVGFQVRPSAGARKLAEKEQIDIRLYSIIYAAIDEIKSAIEGMLSPEIEEKINCNIEVRETFKITKVGTIAGCMVLDGTITRNTTVRIIRDGIVIYTGKLGSLKRFKDDVKEVSSGYECGLNIENFNDIKVGDIIEGFEQIKIARKLDK